MGYAVLGLIGTVVILYLILQSGQLFHALMYSASIAGTANTGVTAANDGTLGTRNNNLIVTEPWNIIAAHSMGALLSRTRFNNAQLIQYAIPHLWPLSVSATVEDQPPVIDWRDTPMRLPMDEEIVVESSMTGAGPTRNELLLLLAAPGWTRNRPTYPWQGIIRGTCVIAAGAEGAWGTPANIVFERDPIGGVYEVFGCEVVAAAAVAFRLVFIDMVNQRGKQLRPGGLVQETAALEPWKVQRGEQGGLGPWGRFHTFMPIQMQVFGDAAGGTYEVRLHVGYIGQDRSLVSGIQV